MHDCKTVFLKLDSAEGCQGFREKQMRNGSRFLLAVISLCIRIKIRVATFDTNNSVADSTQTIAASFQIFLILHSSQSTEVHHWQNRCVRLNDQVIVLYLG
jgi:hypothetical protein